jgi:hypothetical protein
MGGGGFGQGDEFDMHYFFLDESYRDEGARRTITVACWGVEQRRLDPQGEALKHVFRPPIETQICSAIMALDAVALVVSATLDKSLYRTGEIDGTDDVPAMARADNIWTQCITFAIATLILKHLQNGRPVDTIDVYFDPKSLKPAHETAWAGTIRGLVVSEAKRFAAQLGTNRLRKLKIRHIRPVAKRKEGEVPGKFQIGTWIADRLCSRGREMSKASAGHIEIQDMSDTIKRTVRQWDGRSFQDN